MSPRDFAKGYIKQWEDGGSTSVAKTHSLDPNDNGNWSGGAKGCGLLIGSNHGVTAMALADHRNVPLSKITKAVMAALTLDEAADIALDGYYQVPKFDLLVWNQVTASVMDMGWGTGPVQAAKLVQRMIAVADDGKIGRFTAAAYAQFINDHGLEKTARIWADIRFDFYDQIIRVRPSNAIYRNGWRNRTASFLPDTTWWEKF